MGHNTFSIYEFIKKWGKATSISLYDPTISIFNHPDIEGAIGYRDAGRCVVAVGDPLCAEQDQKVLQRAFYDFCSESKKDLVYILASDNYLSHIKNCHPVCGIYLGNELILNPHNDVLSKTGPDPRRLRNKINQAVKNGFHVIEHLAHNPAKEKQFEDLVRRWNASRSGLQTFQQPVDLFINRGNKRWFYVEKDSHILGLILLDRIQQGWVINMSIMAPQAPNFLSDYMVVQILEVLRAEGCEFLTVGTIPSPYVHECYGMNAISQKSVSALYSVAQKLFKISHRFQFWKKFDPIMKPSHLVFQGSHLRVKLLVNMIKAFNGSI